MDNIDKTAMKKYKSMERGALMRGIKFDIKYNEYVNYYQKPLG